MPSMMPSSGSKKIPGSSHHGLSRRCYKNGVSVDIESSLLDFAACFVGRLPEQDIANASDLISRREWGVGLEMLCAQLAEYEVEVDANEVAELRRLALAMGFDAFAVDSWLGL